MSGEIRTLVYNGMIFNHGDYVTCKIDNHVITDARICTEQSEWGSDTFHLCQNIQDGNLSPEMFGYDCSWSFCVYDGGLLSSGVSRLKLADLCTKPRDKS